MRLAEEDENLARSMIVEAASSIGQRRAARLVLFELENRSLERAARERLFVRTAEGDLPFLSGNDDFVRSFITAAADLRAASTSRNHLHRRRALDRAAKVLEETRASIAKKKRSDRWHRRRLITLRTWLDVVDEEKAALSREEAERPQVPLPFIAGPTLGPAERELFKGRSDLIRIIDHDLTGDRRAPILLIGQRRMGKSSLVNMLPIHLGTGTRVVSMSFQGLSGSPLRERPHLWIAESIVEAKSDVAPLPDNGAAWGQILDWLRDLDRCLEHDDRRLLVALDEVERLEDGIREGWANTDLLDLLRAAGDALYRVRFLLATAYPLPRLGPHWVDRLINVLTRQLRPLSPADAESLVREPMPGFPDIYPSGGVERILAATGCHPYLIQLVCDTLCRHLNEEERLRATGDDVELAIDRAILETPLFDELWRQRSAEERQVLRDLAASGSLRENERAAARDLEREGFLSRLDGNLALAVPMFGDWIADMGPADDGWRWRRTG